MASYKSLLTIFSIGLLLASPAIADSLSEKCIYPVPDYDNSPSKPSIVGKILQVNQNKIVIQVDKKNVKQPIRIDSKTALFTVFGGLVWESDLAVGQHVYVWYLGCNAQKAGSPPLAAVIQLDSK